MIGTPANLDVLVLSADLSKGAMRLCLALLQRYNWKEKSGDTIPLTMSYLSHRCGMTAHAISKARRELERQRYYRAEKPIKAATFFVGIIVGFWNWFRASIPGKKDHIGLFGGKKKTNMVTKKDQYGHKMGQKKTNMVSRLPLKPRPGVGIPTA